MLASLLARLAAPALRPAARIPRSPAAIASDQERILRHLVRRLGPLPVGELRGLRRLPQDDDLRSAFRERIEPAGYAEHAPLIARAERGERNVLFPGRVLALAQTSGTTRGADSGERYIPQSRELLRHHAVGGRSAFSRLLGATGPAVLGGRLLLMGGSTDLRPNPHGVPTGDLSGLAISQIPAWLRSLWEPGRDIALDGDWERKLERMVHRLERCDVRVASGIASWLLVLAERLCARRSLGRLREVWPGLRGLVHGGHAIDPLLPGLRHHLDPDTWLLEVYPSSEAFIAVGSRPWRLDENAPPPLEALCRHGVFLEFMPEDDLRGAAAVGPDGLEPGRIYRVLLTTPGGLVRYQIGDLVRGEGPGLLRVAGRIAARISVFGEHVEGSALEQAASAACLASGAELRHFHVAPLLPTPGEQRGAHEWLVEFSLPPEDPLRFTEAVDRRLQETSLDYAAHRTIQLAPPRLTSLPPGSFHAWLRGRGRLGGQHKVPVAWNDRSIAEELLRTAESMLATASG